MPYLRPLTFQKKERLCSKKRIDELFSGNGTKSMAAFPLRAVYALKQQESSDIGEQLHHSLNANDPKAASVQILISVPKKYFKHAVKRNRVKRQIREAYRKHQFLIKDKLEQSKYDQILIAFIFISNEMQHGSIIEKRVLNLLQRITEKIQ